MTLHSLARRAIGVWLMVDGALVGLWFSNLAYSLGGRDAVSVAAMVARVIVAAMSLVAGWLVTQRQPVGSPLAMAALALIAAFAVVAAMSGVLPSNLDPAFRWPLAGLHCAGAIVAILFLRRDGREKM